ncbi:hypothetical protein NEOKW01_0653 [Nematocida sp. AWRm80]|nr:hypothetical protein NEOKW01_0653 [Nematocida sp. AWRm80]
MVDHQSIYALCQLIQMEKTETVSPQSASSSKEKSQAVETDKQTLKSTTLPKNKSATTLIQNKLNDTKNINRKQLSIGNSSYYIITLDEVSIYNTLKSSYKNNDTAPFIIYLNTEFITDLKSSRKKSKLYSVFVFIVTIIVFILVLIILYFIFSALQG